MSELIGKLSDNQTVVIVIAVVALVVLGLLLYLFRSRKMKEAEENRVRSELAILEREHQFAQAAAAIRIDGSKEDVAKQVASLLQNNPGISVYGIYAGKADSEIYVNLLPDGTAEHSSSSDNGNRHLPAELNSSQVMSYSQPQEVSRSIFASESGNVDEENLAIVPWQGIYGWNGIIVGQSGKAKAYNKLSSLQEGFHLLNEKLSIALEMANRQPITGNGIESRFMDWLKSLATTLEGSGSLTELIAATATFFKSDSAAFWIADQQSQMLRMSAATGLRSKELLPLPIGQGLAGNVFASKQSLALEDAAADARCLFPNETRESGICSYLGVPVTDGETPTGVLELHKAKPGNWGDPDIALLETVGSLIAAILKRRTKQANQMKVQSALMGLSESLQRLRAPEDLLDAAVEVLGHACGASRVIAFDLDNPKRPLPVQYEYRKPEVMSATRVAFTDPSVKNLIKAAANGESVVIQNAKQNSPMGEELVNLLSVRSELLIPVRYERDKQILLAIQQCDFSREWKADEIEFADRVGRQLGLSLTNLAALNEATRSIEAAQLSASQVTETANRAEIMINSLPEAVVGLDKEGRLSYFNSTARELFKLKSEDIGRMANWIDSLEPEEEGLWGKIIYSKSPVRLDGVLKNSGSPDSDGKRWVILSAAPVKSESGDINGFMVILTDVKNNKELPRSHPLKLQEAELERRLADLRTSETQTRSRVEKLKALEAEGKTGIEAVKKLEETLMQERENFKREDERFQQVQSQLLLTNQLKSEFIVNTGRDISLQTQSVIALAQMLERGSCGQLNEQQLKAVRDMLGWSQKMKSGLQDLIEYGSSRTRP